MTDHEQAVKDVAEAVDDSIDMVLAYTELDNFEDDYGAAVKYAVAQREARLRERAMLRKIAEEYVAAKLEDAVKGQSEYVLVPRVPTAAMLREGWYEAHEENAAGVWGDMIKAWEMEKMDREREAGI